MRKVLSFVLVLALVLGSFSMAFAATPANAGLSDIAGITNEEAIQVVNDLGIVTGNPDGTFLPEKAVNRAEFAAMITRALAIPESALAGYTATTFKDTAGYGWAVPYLAFCQSKGIMLGDGNGNAMPGRTINMNEAVTMALRAIGYTANSAQLVGAWPSNYVTLAQNSGLYDDVAKVANVDKANAAQIIYNLLTVQKVAVNSDGETLLQWVGKASDEVEATLLNTGLDCTAEDDYIIDGADYDNAVINVSKYMGAFGTAYFNSDDDIVAFTPDSVALTGSKDGNYFKADGVKYTVSNSFEEGIQIVNTDVIDTDLTLNLTAIDTFAEDVDNDDDGDVTINVDLSGKTIKKVYSVVGWAVTDHATAAAADLEDIADDNSLFGNDFVTDDNDDLDLTSFALVGVASLDKIAKDNVVYVYANDNDDIRKVAVGTKVVTGTVSEESTTAVYVDGTKYEPATIAGVDRELPELDQEVELSLDAFGYVYDFEATGGIADNYALVKAYEDKDSTFDDSRVKMYTSDDATKTYTFADKNSKVFTSGSAFDEIATPYGLVAYELDKDGYVDTLDTNSASDALVKLQSAKVLIVGTKYLNVESDAVVFAVDGDDYSVGTVADVKKGVDLVDGSYVAASYILNKDGKVAALLVDEYFFEGGSDDIFAVINTVNNVKDGDDTVDKISGLIDGKEFTKQANDDYLANAGKTSVKLFAMKVNGNDVITEVAPFVATDDTDSHVITTGAVVAKVSSDRTVLTFGTGANEVKNTIDEDAVVYEAVMKADGVTVDKYVSASLTNVKADYSVWLYDTKGDDADGIATIVIFAKDAEAAVVDPTPAGDTLTYNGTYDLDGNTYVEVEGVAYPYVGSDDLSTFSSGDEVKVTFTTIRNEKVVTKIEAAV